MLSLFAKFLLVATAFAPVLLTYAVAQLFTAGLTGTVWLLFAVTGGLVFCCLAVVKEARGRLEHQPFPVESVKSADTEIVAFVVSYLLPLFPASFQTVSVPVVAVAAVVFFIVIFTSNSYHFNPLLGLFGYRFYEVETSSGVTFMLLTRRKLRSSRSVNRIVELTDYMVLDVEHA